MLVQSKSDSIIDCTWLYGVCSIVSVLTLTSCISQLKLKKLGCVLYNHDIACLKKVYLLSLQVGIKNSRLKTNVIQRSPDTPERLKMYSISCEKNGVFSIVLVFGGVNRSGSCRVVSFSRLKRARSFLWPPRNEMWDSSVGIVLIVNAKPTESRGGYGSKFTETMDDFMGRD